MFTGLIEKKGIVIANIAGNTANRLVIRANFDQMQTGESIAVNGVCLTLLPDDEHLLFDVSPETLQRTNLSLLKKGDEVNLERAMLANNRFGGHYVSGHIDTTAYVESIKPIENCLEVSVSHFTHQADLYLLPKGSITLDGVSLTINEVVKGTIQLMLVPHTLAETTLGQWQTGQYLNVEFDYLTRIIAHQLKIAGQLKEVEIC